MIVQNSMDIYDKFQVTEICTRGNYDQKRILCRIIIFMCSSP
jgi:hypothetical protein